MYALLVPRLALSERNFGTFSAGLRSAGFSSWLGKHIAMLLVLHGYPRDSEGPQWLLTVAPCTSRTIVDIAGKTTGIGPAKELLYYLRWMQKQIYSV